MKKLLLFASALTGFALVAQAEEPTTIKTTTVQYSVPTCTNCRTTTEVRTVYPEQQPVCTTCGTPAAEPVVMVKDSQKQLDVPCADNHELGIRNPLFTLKQGQIMGRLTGSLYKEPKRRTPPKGDNRRDLVENRGSTLSGRLTYGLTDKWSISAWATKGFVTPKKKSVDAETWYLDGYHQSEYRAHLATEYHLLDLCHFDLFVGLEGQMNQDRIEYRSERNGSKRFKTNGYGWSPTIKAGFPIGWFTPYIQAAYSWDRHQEVDYTSATNKKSWKKTHGYYVNPGLYFQPSKWVGFDFNYQKWEKSSTKPQWNARVDFYPYKNVSISLSASAKEPTKHPMQMYEGTLDLGIVF